MSPTFSGILAICSLVISILAFFFPYRLTFRKTYAKIILKNNSQQSSNEKNVILKYSRSLHCFFLFANFNVENEYPIDGTIFSPKLIFNNVKISPISNDEITNLPQEIKEIAENFFKNTPFFHDKLKVEKQNQICSNLLFKLPEFDFSFNKFFAYITYKQFRNRPFIKKLKFSFEFPYNLHESENLNFIKNDIKFLKAQKEKLAKEKANRLEELLKFFKNQK